MFIVRQGQPKAAVVLPADAGDELQAAAKELIRVVRASTGARLPLRRAGGNDDDGTGIRLVIDPKLARAPAGHLPPPDTVRIDCAGRTVEIAAGRQRAVAYGVVELLEQAVGARWFWPGKLGEDIPRRKNISVPPGRKTYRPSFDWRSLSGVDREDFGVKIKCQRYPVAGGGHAYHRLLPEKLFDSHPELFSKVYGQRRRKPTQICHAAPGMLDRALEYIEEELAENPGAAAVSFCPNDFGFFCECDACRTMDADVFKYYDYYVNEPPIGYGGPLFHAHLSERIFTFTNAVADRVAKTHPGLYLICFGYGPSRMPPEGMTIRDNVIVWLTATAVGMYNPERAAAEEAVVRDWRKVAKHVVIFEALANQCWPCLPREVSGAVDACLKMYRRHGVRGYFTQMWNDWATNLPSYYLAARLAWDASRDAQEELGELWRRAFGPAARHVERYFQVWRDAWRRVTEPGGLPRWRSVISPKCLLGTLHMTFTPRTMAAARDALAKARKAARGGGIYARRVKWLADGLRLTELLTQAVREVIAIEDMGLPLFYPAPWLRPPYDFDFAKLVMVGQVERRVLAHACERAAAAIDEAVAFGQSVQDRDPTCLGPQIAERISRRAGFGQVRKSLLELAKLARRKSPPDPAAVERIFGPAEKVQLDKPD